MNNVVNIAGLDRAEVLAALYNRSKQQGMGVSHLRGQNPMTVEEAREELNASPIFDYLHGRVMKIRFKEGDDELWVGLYNRDVGINAAEEVIDGLRMKQSEVKSG